MSQAPDPSNRTETPVKVLLLHVPKFNTRYRPIGDLIWLNYMAMGLPAVAEYVHRHGIDVELVHLGVEWVENRAFRVDELVEGRPEVRAVGISLHWHHQAFDAIAAGRRLKALRPDLFLFLGGDTASWFAEEIVRDHPVVDGVIRGHGEVPALRLLEALRDGLPLAEVPNLTWRDRGRVRENPLSYVAGATELDDLSYTDFSLLRHRRTYVRSVGVPFFFAKGFSRDWNARHLTLGKPVFPLSLGRGCPFNCTWCGGGHLAQQSRVSGLRGFACRSTDAILRSVVEARDMGYGIMHTGMDPEPRSQERYVDLWRTIRAEGVRTDWIFECNGLPTPAFAEAFRRAFPGPDSVIAISPECGNERLRMRHKGPGFTNRALLEKLALLERLGVTVELFFTYGLPGENEEMLRETVALQRTARAFRNVRAVRTLAIEMEPGAPWQTDPERFAVVTERRTFRDFHEAHADPDSSPFTSLGYYIPGYFERPLDRRNPLRDFERRMQAVKCRHFCFLHPDPRKGGRPWKGRAFCGLTSTLLRLKPRDLSRPY